MKQIAIAFFAIGAGLTCSASHAVAAEAKPVAAAASTPPAAPDYAAARAAIAKLAFLVGDWEGINTQRKSDGTVITSRAEDMVRVHMDGLLLSIEGRGFAPGAPVGAQPSVVNFGTFRFDEKTGRYLVDSYAMGMRLEGAAKFEEGRLIWNLSAPNGPAVRFTAFADGPNGWIEQGEVSTDGGKSWAYGFEIHFKRRNPL